MVSVCVREFENGRGALNGKSVSELGLRGRWKKGKGNDCS